MNVGNDLEAFARQITERFDATTPTVLTDLSVAMAGFDLEICADVLRELRLTTPDNHRMVDAQKLMENARRMHVARGIEIDGEPPRRVGNPLFIPMEIGKKIDHRTPEEKERDARRERIKAWAESLEESERNRLLDEGLKLIPESLREMYRGRGIKSPVVLDAMLKADHRMNPEAA